MDVHLEYQKLRAAFPMGETQQYRKRDRVSELVHELPGPFFWNHSVAIAVIDESNPHRHPWIETYHILSGYLTVFVTDPDTGVEHVNFLHPGMELIIQPNHVHWARGNAAWVRVTCNPPFDPEKFELVPPASKA